MAQKAPSVIVTFKERGITAIQRSQRGILAMILTEAQLLDPLTIYSVDDIPESGLSSDNIEQIQLALKGYQTSPRKSWYIPSKTLPIRTSSKRWKTSASTGW